MRVFNVMMCRDLGGIQQAFLDYEQALLLENHEVINIISTNAEIEKFLKEKTLKLPNLTSWCPISKIYLCILVKRFHPDVIIVHGGRASNFACSLKVAGIPVVGITHNYSYKRLKRCDHVISLTNDLRQDLLKAGYPDERMHSMPNMIKVDKSYLQKSYKKPITIGTYGRLVENKGFHHLILSMRKVIDSGIDARLIIGGDGEEKDYLFSLVKDLGLEREVNFIGWVNNKDKFFESIDIFCCPSEHEPFGIVILEAMKYSTPIIATMSQGPSEILDHNKEALIAKNRSPEDLAAKIIEIIQDEDLSKSLAEAAYRKVKQRYDLPVVASTLSKILKSAIVDK